MIALEQSVQIALEGIHLSPSFRLFAGSGAHLGTSEDEVFEQAGVEREVLMRRVGEEVAACVPGSFDVGMGPGMVAFWVLDSPHG